MTEDINTVLRREFFAGVHDGDYFPRGGTVGIYCPDWSSEFMVTIKGQQLMCRNKFISAFTSPYSMRSRQSRVLRLMYRGYGVKDIEQVLGDKYINRPLAWLTGEEHEFKDFCRTMTWLLRDGYVIRIVDRSI